MSDGHRAIEAWLRERGIVEVECIVPDLAGVPRGKILPTDKFIEGLAGGQHRLPKNVLVHTLTGDFPPPGAVSIDVSDGDFVLEPDPATLALVPWYDEPTAQVIADCVLRSGGHSPFYSRRVLASLLERFAERGWHPVIAPEIEFYLVEKNTDPDQPLKPPIGASGRREAGRQEFGIDAVNEFDPFFEDLYDYCEAQALDIDTLNHESGAGQVEINFRHGDALRLADQVFVFKRTVRQTAQRHGFYATFMAKPMQSEPGSAMHVHQSVYEGAERRPLFSDEDGAESPAFRHYLGGLQRFLPAFTPLMAPNVNSFRRLRFGASKPFNVGWGYDNRIAGLRVPDAPPANRRVENRLPGSDTNPYLTIAATLAAGYLGMTQALEPAPPVDGEETGAYETLPLDLRTALEQFEASDEAQAMFGDLFVKGFCEIVRAEYDAYLRVVSSWERKFLLLAV